MIDYNKINESITFYENKGFKRIEVPWTVSQYTANITKPSFKEYTEENVLKHNNKTLVASGEQSFLYLYLKKFLPLGKYQAVTPCFRNESFDFLHSKYFVKNELIQTVEVSESNLNNIIDSSLEFFKNYIDNSLLEVKKTGNQEYDILVNIKTHNDNGEISYKKIELGSYGIRTCDFLKWIYSTGLAEPRLSRTINYIKNNGIS